MSSEYRGLRFSFADTEREIEGMLKLARKFLERDSPERIAEWKERLRLFRVSKSEAKFDWQIPEAQALRTKPSNGEYERGSRCGRETVIAAVSGIWEIHRLPEGDKDRNAQYLLNGKASVKVQLLRADDAPLASWQFDIGDAASPGCHFHLQFANESHLPVPRYPALLFTPMDAVEFALAELFQDRWKQHALTQSHSALWAECQRRRVAALLRWQCEWIEECSGSPWTAFKGAKPPQDLFVR